VDSLGGDHRQDDGNGATIAPPPVDLASVDIPQDPPEKKWSLRVSSIWSGMNNLALQKIII
jgi:hypothetical protein